MVLLTLMKLLSSAHSGTFAMRSSFPWLLCLLYLVATESSVLASDHADPVDFFNNERLEGGITDLFVFPVNKNDEPVYPYERKGNLPLHDLLTDVVRAPLNEQQMDEIDSIVAILCVRRALTQTGTLRLTPYTYKIHFDVDSTIEYPTEEDVESEKKLAVSRFKQVNSMSTAGYSTTISPSNQNRPTRLEAYARYGGWITSPDQISEDITIEFRLDDQAGIAAGYPNYIGSASAGWKASDSQIVRNSGIFEDPFIFPAFFGTNIVAMAIKIPIELFPKGRTNFLIWATSHLGTRQVDHVGRSLRTQNPRFEMLNVLHPSKHRAAIQKEHDHPSLMRDIFLRAGLADNFAFRKWDFVPDVICYSTKYPVGFPNGRLLTDDVAAMLAQYGDVLLYELSFQHNNGTWPREMTNDANGGMFNAKFPFLLAPFPDRAPPDPPRLSPKSSDCPDDFRPTNF